MTVAALFVEENGVYANLPGVDVWGISRDARKYPGPYPVVAHPPCSRWCQMAPVNQARYGQLVGDDDGCFEMALINVRFWGGVLEHPAYSLAWERFGLRRPNYEGGWQNCESGGYVCQVAQRNYGHRATKLTWLYAHPGHTDSPGVDLPAMIWGRGAAPEAWISTDRPRAELAARGIAQLSKREAKATPPAFRDLLLSIAESCHRAPGGKGEATNADR